MKKMIKIGIDEAGRGPLAGPLSLAAVYLVADLDLKVRPFSYLAGEPFKDSKKLTEKMREAVFEAILNSKEIIFEHLFVSAKEIDKRGLSQALFSSVTELTKRMQEKLGLVDGSIELLLDGALRAPSNYKWSAHTKGDEKFLEITLASVVAKVMRDRYMLKVSEKYPCYSFDKHKGYGTKVHKEAIKKHGKCPEHRNSFIHFV